MRTLAIVASLMIPASALIAADTPQDRLNDSATVFNEIMSAPDKGIPQDLMNKAQCVVIVPGMKKGAFIVGGEYGRGFAECRSASGWGAPAAVKVEGGSFGFQIGGQETDVVMLVMNRSGMDKLMRNNFKLGADASIAAGPVGRSAQAATDLELHAEILSYSRSRGAFAGVSLAGAVVKADEKTDEALYGHKMASREILASNMAPPAGAQSLIAALDKYSARSEHSGTAARERH